MRTVDGRTGLTLIVTVVCALLGMAASFLLFRFVTLHAAMVELDHHSWRYMLRAEQSSNTSEHFLHAMAAAGLAPCSDAEIAYIHSLLIQTEFLKDGGRMSGGRVQCDAWARPTELTQQIFEPTFRLKDGTEVYTDLRMVPGDPEPRVGVQRGGFFVSYSHWRPDRLGDLPLKFTLTEVGNTKQAPGWLHGEKSIAPAPVLSKDGWARVGDTLYTTHCSPHYFNCFTTFIDVPSVFAARTAEKHLWVAFGGLAGAFLGYFCVLLYRRNQSMVRQLRRAIRSERLRMLYQPIVDLRTRRIVGAEALARWTDDGGFDVNPEMFVSVAEASGLVGELTAFVVRRTLRDMGDILRDHPDFSLSINVTSTDLGDPAFLPMLERSLAGAQVETPRLVIEVTESSTARTEIAAKTIHRLRKRGHRVHIDDFGTGYSSLSYLHSLAVDAIKIDKTFTHAIGTEAITLGILPQILAMAKALNLDVVAEGIETEEQADYLSHCCEQTILGQGWLFGRPVAGEQLRRLLHENEEWLSTQVREDNERQMQLRLDD